MLPTSDSETGTGSYSLDLPPELREMIFTFALVSTNPVDILNIPKNHVAALTQTSQQLRAETIKIYYGQNTFKLNIDIDTIDVALQWLRGIETVHILRIPKIIVEFSAIMEQVSQPADAALKELWEDQMIKMKIQANEIFYMRAIAFATALMATGISRESLEPGRVTMAASHWFGFGIGRTLYPGNWREQDTPGYAWRKY
ncbi:hypothetical protein LTR27_012662 [Elasticomyces elasticus]|nr:hypothetical protein LTR27_012662 [Elasticomyces elasticus]